MKKREKKVKATMAEIPDEVMTEILSRLPAKSICRFRCVCKQWCNLFYNSEFIEMHLSRAISRDVRDLLVSDSETITKCKLKSTDGKLNHSGIGICMFRRTLISWFDGNSFHKLLKFKDPLGESFGRDNSKLLASCNGIVCLVKKNQACLVNPCTREYKIVVFDEEVDFLRVAAYGFGYDAIKEDYKVVQIVETDYKESEINVYSINDASTNKISNVPFTICAQKGGLHMDEKQSGFYLNGAIYWPVKHKFKRAEQVIAFEVGTNDVREVPRPDSLPDDEDDWDSYHMACLTMGVVDGQLALFKTSYRFIEIWVLKNNDANALWCQVLSIKKPGYYGGIVWPRCCNDCELRPLYFTKTGKVLVNDKDHLVMYNLNEMENRNLNVQWIPVLPRTKALVLHCPSFVPLKSGLHAEIIIGVEVEESAH